MTLLIAVAVLLAVLVAFLAGRWWGLRDSVVYLAEQPSPDACCLAALRHIQEPHRSSR